MPNGEKPLGDTFTFTFKDELPINAWNVILQIAFRGTLGEETSKIVVSTIDLSEPTFFAAYNNTDFVLIGDKCYTAQQVAASSDLWQRVNPTCKYPLHAEDILSDACYKAKFGFRLQEAKSADPHYQIVTEIEVDKDQRVSPGRFSRFAMLMDPRQQVHLALKFRNPGIMVGSQADDITVMPYHAHTSRTILGQNYHDPFFTTRGIKTWQGFAYMVDAEQASVAVSNTGTCVTAKNGELPALVGGDRYPLPSTIIR